MTTDEILGIGTVYTLEYDRDDIEELRKAMSSDMQPGDKARAIDEALKPLLIQRDAAFALPNLTYEQTEMYAHSTLRTVRFNARDERLIWDAMTAHKRLTAILREV